MKKSILPSLLFLLIGQLCWAQEFVKDYGIESPVHEANVGKVTFMPAYIPIGEYAEDDFMMEVELNKKTNLFMRTFLKKSLTNYLHELAPDLMAEELIKKGNYQFSFLVDGKLVYEENLNAGAGTAETKNNYTIFSVPLTTEKKIDSWGRFLWMRFMMKGGQIALAGGAHMLEVQVRPYIKLKETLVGEIIAQGQITTITPVAKLKEKQLAVQEIAPTVDWEIGRNEIKEKEIRSLNRRIATDELKDITSLVVIKEGKLILESYYNGAKRKTLHDTRSVGKSFLSALTGLAIQEGHLKSEQQRLEEFYPLDKYAHATEAKKNVTIENLLTMSASFDGFDFDQDSPGTEDKMQATDNWVEFTLNLPTSTAKTNGGQWNYFTAGCGLLGDILHKTIPAGLESFAATKLFAPLDIKNHKWFYTPQKLVYMGGGLRLSALDLAKFGQLFKNGGSWKGKQILNKDWVDKCLSQQIELPEGGNGHYGYLFWNQTFEVKGKKYEAFLSSGNGGNKIVIFNDLPIVMVITATAYNQAYMHGQAQQIIENHLLPAVLND